MKTKTERTQYLVAVTVAGKNEIFSFDTRQGRDNFILYDLISFDILDYAISETNQKTNV